MKMTNIIQRISGKDPRSALLLKNVLASLAVKGWSVVVQLLLVPLTLACLGVYENGVWLTISSVLLWIDNLDVGLGNGLRNKLAVCLAENNIEKARQMVSSTIAMLTCIIVPVTILLASTIMVCATFILKFLGNFYMGLQLPAINNAIVTGGNTLALIGTGLVYLSGRHSLLLVAMAYTAGPLLSYLICLPITFLGRYRHLCPSFRLINVSAMKELFNIGSKFFVLQIAGIVLLFTILCVPYWSATTDAYAKHDFAWIRQANRTLNKIMLGIALLIGLMTIGSPLVYHIWIGTKASVPFSMTVLVGLYELILILSTRYSFVLNGIGALRLQLYVTIAMALCYVPLAIWVVGQYNNINALLLLMCFINMPGLVVNIIQYYKIIGGKAKGIWVQ